MTLDTNAARLLLRNHLLDVVGLPRFVSENRASDRPDRVEGELYVEEKLVIASERHVSVGFIETLGQYRMIVHTAQYHGTAGAEAVQLKLVTQFQPTRTLCAADDSFGLVLYRTERPAPIAKDGWIAYPVVAYWRSHTSTLTPL